MFSYVLLDIAYLRWLWWPMIFYLFWGMAHVCDIYFVSSIEVFSKRFKISDDAGGLSLQAIFLCSSSGELDGHAKSLLYRLSIACIRCMYVVCKLVSSACLLCTSVSIYYLACKGARWRAPR